MKSLLAFFIVLLFTGMAIPSPLVFSNTPAGSGYDPTQFLALGDTTGSDTTATGSDVNSISGAYSDTNFNLFTNSNAGVHPDVPGLNLAPDNYRMSSISGISSNVPVDSIHQDLVAQGLKESAPCPQGNDWATIDTKTKQQENRQQALNQFSATLEEYKAMLLRCSRTLLSGTQCEPKDLIPPPTS